MTKLTIKDWSELVRFKATPMVQRGYCTLGQWIIWPMPKGWLHLKNIANGFHSETIEHSSVQKSYHCSESGLRIYGNRNSESI